MPLPYAHPVDVARALDKSPDMIDESEKERYATRAAAASQKWDSDTGTPMRSVRVGAPERPETWEVYDAADSNGYRPVVFDLNHSPINPIDPEAGDTIEVRDGRDEYNDITDEQGDGWVIDYPKGQLKIYRFIINTNFFERSTERFLRITYRHGALGGSRERGSETTLSTAAEFDTDTLDVVDASFLPEPPFAALVGSGVDLEYVRVLSLNGDSLNVTRGVSETVETDHPQGAEVQYVPRDVREAVAAKAAERLVMNDDSDFSVPENATLSSRAERAQSLSEEYDRAAASYSGVRTI